MIALFGLHTAGVSTILISRAAINLNPAVHRGCWSSGRLKTTVLLYVKRFKNTQSLLEEFSLGKISWSGAIWILQRLPTPLKAWSLISRKAQPRWTGRTNSNIKTQDTSTHVQYYTSLIDEAGNILLFVLCQQNPHKEQNLQLIDPTVIYSCFTFTPHF